MKLLFTQKTSKVISCQFIHFSPILIFAIVLLFSPSTSNAQHYADCESALKLCSKEEVIYVETLSGPGKYTLEAYLPCVDNKPETASAWLHWEIEESGSLEFTINPLNHKDDIDFFLFKVTKTEDKCKKWMDLIRCMGSGLDKEISSCIGQVGLKEGHKDKREDSGCKHSADRFLAPVYASAGQEYVLLINNLGDQSHAHNILYRTSQANTHCDPIELDLSGRPFYMKELDGYREPELKKLDGFFMTFNGTATFKCNHCWEKNVPFPLRGSDPELFITKTVTVKQKNVTIKIIDNKIPDEELVSIYLNNEVILENIMVTEEEQSFPIQLDPDCNLLSVFNVSSGKRGVNTVSVLIDDGHQQKSVPLQLRNKEYKVIELKIET